VAESRLRPVCAGCRTGRLGLRRGALFGDLSLKAGDDLHVAAATSIRIPVVKETRREKAIARRRARGLRFRAGCVFERDEAGARRAAGLF